MGIHDLFRPNVEKMAAKRDIKGLIKALDDPDGRIRAALALLDLGDERAVEPLILVLKGSKGGLDLFEV